MGNWTLLSVKVEVTDFETAELFGSNVVATFALKYTRARIGKFQETPRLDWHETILMNEHNKGEHWTFVSNMYTHNPLSKTLEIWPKRYVQAFEAANGRKSLLVKGYAKLLDANGTPVPANKLTAKKAGAQGKAEAVRSYLKSKGGIFEIQIHDIPSINKPKPGADTHKERLLLFHCGVEGGGPRMKAYQYLNVDAALPPANWARKGGLGWGISGLKTTGLKKVPAPQGVSHKRPAIFTSGETW